MMDNNKLEIEIKIFNANTASKEDWEALHKYRKRYHNENVPELPKVDDEAYEHSLRAKQSNPDKVLESYEIVYKGEQIGALGIYYEKDSSSSFNERKDEMQFTLKLLKDFASKGFEQKALIKVYEIAKENYRKLLISNTMDDDGKYFLKSIGAEEASVTRTNKLDYNDINWEMLKEWVREGKSINPDLKLKIFKDSIPEKLLVSFCKTKEFSYNQAPIDNLQTGKVTVTPESERATEKRYKELGIITETAVIINKNNEVLGLTELLNFGNVDFFDQQITGVLLEQRGKKLGKWLKASLLMYVKDKYPGKNQIMTSNAESNDAMLAINDKLGFRKLREESKFQITFDNLEKYLKNYKLIS